MAQTTNELGLDLIKEFEGCRLDSYKLEGEEYYTIGYGHSFDKTITAKTVWTKDQAIAALKHDLKKFEDYVTNYAKQYGFKFNDNQFSALVSYCYNRGPGGIQELFSHSTTVADVGHNMVIYWGHAERYKTGLVRRRKAEQELFMRAVPAPAKPAPKPVSKPVVKPTPVKPKPEPKPAPRHVKTIHELALDVIAGKLGDGEARKKALGKNYAAVQAEVTKLMKK